MYSCMSVCVCVCVYVCVCVSEVSDVFDVFVRVYASMSMCVCVSGVSDVSVCVSVCVWGLQRRRGPLPDP